MNNINLQKYILFSHQASCINSKYNYASLFYLNFKRDRNKPLPICLKPLFQSEAICEAID